MKVWILQYRKNTINIPDSITPTGPGVLPAEYGFPIDALSKPDPEKFSLNFKIHKVKTVRFASVTTLVDAALASTLTDRTTQKYMHKFSFTIPINRKVEWYK